MCLERGITKNYCPWDASFDLQVLQIPTYARVGGVGLNIINLAEIVNLLDRAITITLSRPVQPVAKMIIIPVTTVI